MHGMCSTRQPVPPVAWVCLRVPVGTRGSRAPAHPPGGGLARARGSGCSSASSLSRQAFPPGVLCAGYRSPHFAHYFTRHMAGCAVARPLTLGGSLALCRPAGGIFYGTPSGTALGCCSLLPFRQPSHHARGSLGSSPRVCIAPPAPPSGGVLGLAAVVIRCSAAKLDTSTGCSSFIRRRQITPFFGSADRQKICKI